MIIKILKRIMINCKKHLNQKIIIKDIQYIDKLLIIIRLANKLLLFIFPL